MKILSLLISVLALALALTAYQRTRTLEQLMPLAQAVSEAKTATNVAKEKTIRARETAGQMLIDLGRELKGKD